MSPSALRPRLLLILALAGLLVLLPAAGASASGQPPQCFQPGVIEIQQGETFRFTAHTACSDPEGDPLTGTITSPPAEGTLSGPDGSGFFTYTAPTGYLGEDSFSAKVNDGTSDSNEITVTFNVVEPVDDPPACFLSFTGPPPGQDGRFQLEAGDSRQATFSCSDPEGANLAFSVQDPPDHGTLGPLQENPAGGGFESATVTYTAGAAQRGPDEFTLRVNDGTHNVDRTILVNVVEPVNDPPQCFASIFNAPQDPQGRHPVEAGEAAPGSMGCSDDEGANLTFSVLDGPDHGTLSPLQENQPSGGFESVSFSYTSAADYRGPDELTLRTSDGTHDVDTLVKVNVIAPANNPPACGVSFFNHPLGQDGRFAIEDGDVAQGTIGCSDDEGADLTFSVVDGPDHGTLSSLQEGPPIGTSQSASFTYRPTAGYRGPDELTLRGSDGTHDVDRVVRINVIEPADDPPRCFGSIFGSPPGTDGRFPVEAGEPAQGSIGCSDDEGDDLAFSVQDPPDHGTLGPLRESPGGPGSESATFTFTPDAAHRGPDQLTLRATDGAHDVDTVIRVNVIAPVNDAPQCSASIFPGSPGQDGRVTVEAGEEHSGFIGCSDDEQADLTFSVVDAPDNGTLSALTEGTPGSGFQNASFTYTPDTDHRGPDELTLRASDGANDVDRTIRVNVVEPVNDDPQCSIPNPIQVEQGQTLVFDAETACSDPEGDPLTLTITDQPDHGPPITGPDEDGLFTYTAPTDYTGPDSFGVEISDGVNTIQRTVNIQVIPLVDDPPECFGDFVEVQQPESATIVPGCFDPEDGDLTYTVTQQPQHGTLTGDPADEGWLYTPDPGFTGTDSFSYKANDGVHDSEVVTVEIEVLEADRLLLAPVEDTPEVGSTHTVTATVRDGSGTPQADKRVRWTIEGAGATITGTALTGAFGQVEISWSRPGQGTDVLTAFLDDDNDGVRDPGEAQQTAQAHWRAESDVAPPDAGTPTRPNGDPLNVPVGEIVDPDDPGERYFTISRSQTSAQGVGTCAGVQDSRAMNLPISMAIESGAGTVVAGSVELFQVATGAGSDAAPLDPPGVKTPTGQSGSTYSFVLDCIRTGDLYVRYTLDEGANQQEFTVPIGGIVLIDPQGVVYDRAVYDQRIGAGDTPEQARAAAAIQGATVTLQRKVGSDFVTVLSGDPGISPHVNPQTTGADGKYQWDVSAGVYRVVVEKAGYVTQTSQEVTIPPPVLDLHVAMEVPDTTAPDTSITGGPTGATSDTTPTFEFSSTEAGSIFECKVDSGAFAPCASPFTTGALPAGQHTFEVRAKDTSGNTDASPASRTFTVATGGGGGGGGGPVGGGPPGGGGPGGGTGGPGGGQSGAPCEGLTGRALARCNLERTIQRKCGRLKGKRKKLCAKRERAISKCKAVKNKSKKKACLRKAKKIGKKKPR